MSYCLIDHHLVLGVLVGWLRVACWADARGNPHQPFRRETTHSSVPLSFTSPRPPKHPHVPVPAKSLSTLPTPTGHGQNPETEHRKPCEPRPADATALSCEISWRMSSATAAAIKREAATKAELDELQAKRRDVSEGGHLRDEPALRLSAATLQRSEHAVVAVD